MGRERPGHTLGPTALVDEAVLRLLNGKAVEKATNRQYLFGAASRAMRHALVDHHRRRRSREGKLKRVPLDEALLYFEEKHLDIEALSDALDRLSEIDERQGLVVALRFFAGLSVAEVAEVLDVSVGTVELDWRFARAWSARSARGSGSMTPERWREVYDLFREALPLASEAREALLAARCAGDPELRQEVQRLLARDEQAEQEDFLAPPRSPLQTAWPLRRHVPPTFDARTAGAASRLSSRGRSTRFSVPPASRHFRSSPHLECLGGACRGRTGLAGTSFSRPWAREGSAPSIGPTIPI